MDNLIRPGTGFETLDRKLALALQSILPRDLEIRVNAEKTTQLDQRRVLITGRQVLWLIYRHFQTNPNQTRVYGITELSKIGWFGDRKKAKFLNFWNERMSLAAGQTQYWMKVEILYNAMKESQDLRLDMLAYHQRFPNNTGEEQGQERYDALTEILHRTVNREREEEHRQEREAHDRRYMERVMKPVPAMPATGKGKGKKGKSKPRSPSQKGKGKGNGKTRSKSAKGNRKGDGGKKGKGERGLCAVFVTLGSCARGGDCSYRHEQPKNEEEAKYYRDMHTRIVSRSNSPIPKGRGKGECAQWKNSGTCRFGDKCKFEHADGTAAPAASDPKRKGQRKRSSSRSKLGTGKSVVALVTRLSDRRSSGYASVSS